MLNEIGKSNEGIIYGGISGLAGLISNYETVLDVLKGLVVVYGTYKVALMIARYEQKLQVAANLLVVESNGLLVTSEARVIAAKMRSAEAQKSLNASMLANPYVLAAAAIAAVGFAIYKLSTYQTDLEKALERTSIEIENETDKALDLFSALKATKQGTEAWEKARQKIISQYGDLLPKQISELDNLEKQKTALDLVTKSLSANIAERVRLETVTNISSEYNPAFLMFLFIASVSLVSFVLMANFNSSAYLSLTACFSLSISESLDSFTFFQISSNFFRGFFIDFSNRVRFYFFGSYNF